jgi:hypothetical protein
MAVTQLHSLISMPQWRPHVCIAPLQGYDGFRQRGGPHCKGTSAFAMLLGPIVGVQLRSPCWRLIVRRRIYDLQFLVLRFLEKEPAFPDDRSQASGSIIEEFYFLVFRSD